MVGLEQAKTIASNALKEIPIEEYETVTLVEDEIIETDTAWFVPFEHETTQFYGGAINGFIIDKETGMSFRPGSAFAIEKWLEGYSLGLKYDVSDLKITAIRDSQETKRLLNRLRLQYIKPEQDGDTIWKIAKPFTSKMLDEKLSKIPCVFKRQRLAFFIDEFIAIAASSAFEYELTESNDIEEGIA